MAKNRVYLGSLNKTLFFLNGWDILALSLVLSILGILAWGGMQMGVPYQLGEHIPISLDPANLPVYSLRTVLRILIAMIFSLLFTFIFGTWAAKSKWAEKILIPLFDIFQSVPVLSFLSISVVGFIALFPNSLLGPECASIFATFTSQVWNMVFSFYQSLRSVPQDLQDTAHALHLSPWQRFWRIEVPFATPSLLWNCMVSVSASWFFVVASEAIFVANQPIQLPGIGSYIATAIAQSNQTAIMYTIVTMLIVIFIYDQVLFRPLLKWSERFYFDQSANRESYTQAWVLNILERTYLMRSLSSFFMRGFDRFVNIPWLQHSENVEEVSSRLSWQGVILMTSVILIVSYGVMKAVQPMMNFLSLSEVWFVLKLGLITALRIFILLIVSCFIWVPVGVWIGLRPGLTQWVQPVVQFVAAFPANLVFPIVVMMIVQFKLDPEIWLSPLIMLGSQWYILFNVIAGVESLPKDIKLVATNLGIKGWLWWKRILLPAIFPYLVTGAITAVGGAWNASIVAEIVSWGNETVQATGLGSYITIATHNGDFARIMLGTLTMVFLVLVFNRFVWQPLYDLAKSRYQIG